MIFKFECNQERNFCRRCRGCLDRQDLVNAAKLIPTQSWLSEVFADFVIGNTATPQPFAVIQERVADYSKWLFGRRDIQVPPEWAVR